MICCDGRVFQHARRLIAALFLAGSGVVLAQLPAHACSCVSTSTQTHVKRADEVFSGTVTDATSARSGRKATTWTYDVEVRRIYKGEVATSTVQVTSQGDDKRSSCGLGQLPADKPYVFFAQADGSELSADGCGGTAPASGQLVSKVERVLGDGHTPAAPEPAPEKAVFTRVADAAPTALSRLAAPGVALVLAGLLGLFVARRLGAR